MRSKENPQPPVTRREKRAAVTQRIKDFPELPNRVIGRQLGVSHTYVAKIRRELGIVATVDSSKKEWLNHPHIKENPHLLDASERTLRALRAPGVLDLMMERKIGARYAQALLRRAANEAKENSARLLTEHDIHIECADVFTGLHGIIGDETVNLVLVDPPYDRSAVTSGLYKAIGQTAVRVLKPGCALVVMCGHKYLNKIVQQLDEVEGLSYTWCLHYITQAGGGASYTPASKAMSFCKPCLLYIKGAAKWTGQPFSDLIHAAPPDKTRPKYHPHEQDVTGFMELIKRFTEPADLVADFCAGSGTTGVSAIKLRRKFIGTDISTGHVDTARARLLKALEEQG